MGTKTDTKSITTLIDGENFQLQNAIFQQSSLLADLRGYAFCQTSPLLPSVTKQQNVMEC